MKLKLTDSTKNYIKSAFQADALNKISGFRFLREIVFMLKEQDSLIDILLLLKEHSIIESFTGRNIDNYNEKIIEIFESSGLYDVDSEKLFKAIFIFFYSNQIGKEFMRIHFEKFGFKQKVLKKTQQGQSFEKILLLIVK